jgi:hypothetical protein
VRAAGIVLPDGIEMSQGDFRQSWQVGCTPEIEKTTIVFSICIIEGLLLSFQLI